MALRLPSGDVNPEHDHPSDPTDPEAARERYLDQVVADAARFSAAVRRGPLDAGIAACPGWDLRQLAAHLGSVHRWARHCATHAAPPESFGMFAPEATLTSDELADWINDGVDELISTLRAIDLDGPSWHPFPVERFGRVWPRRQAHELAIHRWDAEVAVGMVPHPIDPELASDGIDEYFELVVPRLVVREGVALPAGSLHVHCTDTHGEWLLTTDPEYTMIRAHQKGDAALRGPAEAILLRLWGRESALADQLSPVGDEQVLGAWLALAGL